MQTRKPGSVKQSSGPLKLAETGFIEDSLGRLKVGPSRQEGLLRKAYTLNVMTRARVTILIEPLPEDGPVVLWASDEAPYGGFERGLDYVRRLQQEDGGVSPPVRSTTGEPEEAETLPSGRRKKRKAPNQSPTVRSQKLARRLKSTPGSAVVLVRNSDLNVGSGGSTIGSALEEAVAGLHVESASGGADSYNNNGGMALELPSDMFCTVNGATTGDHSSASGAISGLWRQSYWTSSPMCTIRR